MTLGRVRVVGFAVAGLAAVVLVTWLLEQVVPPPYSGYLALVGVGLAAVEIYKRRPPQVASRLFTVYLKARARGADEATARGRLLARVAGAGRHPRLTADVEAAWTGPSEKERALGGLAPVMAHLGKPLDPAALAAAWDRARNRFTIPGWEALPREFTEAVRDRLDERERHDLDGLVDRYALFHQRFFRNSASLGADAAHSVADFARLLQSVGNRLAGEAPGDAERAYRLSLRLRPAGNLAHAGLAILLDRTGRTREAKREAEAALAVLDEYARHAGQEPPSREDIGRFRSPDDLRQALRRVAAGG